MTYHLNRPHAPFSRGQVGGAAMAMKPCRECGQNISTSANPCPHCGKPSPLGMSVTVRYGGGSLLFLVALGIAFAATSTLRSGPSQQQPQLAAETVNTASLAPAPARKQPSLTETVLSASTYEQALSMVRPALADSVDEVNPGAAILAMWFARRGKLSDVAVTKDETTISKVRKDSESERGKRLCVRGNVTQIQRERVAGVSLWTGNLMTGRMDIVNFLAGGSSGEIVDGSRARLCGVVAGEYAFANVSGGQTRSVQVVGMFDLPDNRL